MMYLGKDFPHYHISDNVLWLKYGIVYRMVLQGGMGWQLPPDEKTLPPQLPPYL